MADWRVLREPAVPILLAASVVHVVRRNAIDFGVFFGTAVVILIDARRHDMAPAGVARIGRPRAWLVVAGMTLFSALVALAAPASLGARLVLVVVGLGALVLVLARPQRSPALQERPAARGWPVWAVIGVAACLWELTSFIAQQVWPLDQDAHPAVSDLVEPLLQTWFGRAVFLVLWASAGWWLLRRLVGPGPDSERKEQDRTGGADRHGAGQNPAPGGRGRSSRDWRLSGRRSEPGRRHTGPSSVPDRADGHSEAGR